jgi:hypothetical protein
MHQVLEYSPLDDPKKRMRPGTKKAGGNFGDKSNKGLRHFSMKVCQKVEEKGTTTYNEVADELVKEFGQQRAQNEAMGSPVSYVFLRLACH